MMLRPLLAAAALFTLSAPAWAQAGPGALFDRFDADRDGAVTYSEVQAWRVTFFEAADSDADGYVTQAELEAVQEAAGAAASDRGRGGRRGPRAQRDPMTLYDADGDGQLSRSEYVDAPFAALERFDSNGDGQLTRDELPGRRRGG